MSRAVKDRTPDQCRGHHRKMVNRFGVCTKIINNLQKMTKNYKGKNADKEEDNKREEK